MFPYKRTALLMLLVLAVFPLLDCGGHGSDEKYFFVTTNSQIPYWQSASSGFTQAARDLKVRYEYLGPDSYDPAAEQQAFEKAVSGKATGILISVADAKVLTPDINKAIAAGIPVLTVDSDAPESKRLFFIGTNNYQAGVSGGKRLAQELHSKGNIVVFTIPDQPNVQDRLRGYRDALDNTQIKIVQEVDMRGDPRVAFDIATQIVGKQRDKVDGFVCLEALSGKEVATVLSNNGIKGKVVMAMDTDPDTLEWIRKGVIAATVSQKPYTMAFFGLMMLDHLYHNKIGNLQNDWATDSFAPIPAFVDTGSSLIDKSNVDSFLQSKKSATGNSK